jgi:hypothetical protein
LSTIFIEKHLLLDELATAFARAQRRDREQWALYARPIDGRLDVLHDYQDSEGLVRLIGCWGLTLIADQDGHHAEHPDFDAYGAAEMVLLKPEQFLPVTLDGSDGAYAAFMLRYID